MDGEAHATLCSKRTIPMRPRTTTLCALVIMFGACKKEKDDAAPTPTPTAITVTDVDGNTYSTAAIGSQVWMAENLRTTKYRDGSAIPEVTVNAAWQGLSIGTWCNYGNYSGNNATFGKLYNWHAVNDARGLCPQGWHVPTDAEWKTLETTLGMLASEVNITGYRGDAQNVGGKLKSTIDLWEPPNDGATNSSGFAGLPGGFRDEDGNFVGVRYYGDWWTATQVDAANAWTRELDNEDSGIYRYGDYPKGRGLCVRCIRD